MRSARGQSCQCLPKFDKAWPTLAKVWPSTNGQLRPMSVEIGQFWPESANTWPESANLGRMWPYVDQVWTKSFQIWRSLDNIGRIWAKFQVLKQFVDNVWARKGSTRTILPSRSLFGPPEFQRRAHLRLIIPVTQRGARASGPPEASPSVQLCKLHRLSSESGPRLPSS